MEARYSRDGLQEFSSGQVFHEFMVSFEKVIRKQIFARGPLHIAEDAVLDLTFMLANNEETQFHHAAVGIFVLDTGQFVADGGVDAEFFFQFAAKGGAGLFAFLNFSAGKLPLERHGLMARSLAHQQLVIFHNQSCNDTFHARPRDERKLRGGEFSHTRPISGARTGPLLIFICWTLPA
jgi:hypothetical protein